MSIAEVVRDEVARAPIGSWFIVKDLAERLGQRRAVEIALGRVAQSGELVLVRRGLYWKGVKTRFGTTKPDTFIAGLGVLRAVGFESGVGPTGWSASHALGLSTQIPAETHIAVPGRPPAPSLGVKYHERSSRWRTDLGLLEVALLEILREFPYQIEADWEMLEERALKLHAEGKLDLIKVAAVSAKETHCAARDRAGSLARSAQQKTQLSA